MTSHLFPNHRKLIWLVIAFLLIGQIILFSATGVMALEKQGSEFYYSIRQGIWAIIGLVLMITLSKFSYEKLRDYAFPIMALQILLVAATRIPGIGHHASGATRWIHIGPLLFQPSELAKISLAIYAAHLLAIYKENRIHWKRILVLCIPIVILLLLIFKQPDLGTTTLLTCMLLGMLFISGLRLIYLGSGLTLGAIAFVTAMLTSDYRRRRFFSFLNPWADPQGSGFQAIQSFLSFRSGGLFGTGLGNGNSKLFYLPEVHTDFIFSLIGEELGFVGAIVVLLLFAYFSYLVFKVAYHAKDPFGNLLAFGLGLSLCLQIAVNLGGVTGLLPVKGLPLPFISWGRSALLVNLMMMGILLNIARTTIVKSEE